MTGARARLHPHVHGFDRAAERYERSRPGYPPAAIRHLRRQLGLGPGRTVVELGSGTGKLTRSLLGTGAAVVALEPIAGMRRVFRRELPATVVLAGAAEAIPLPDGFADAVVVGQAFHWFQVGPAAREIARVLRPSGGLGLLWNVRDESTGPTRRLTELIDRFGGRVSHAKERRWLGPFRRSRAGFGPLRLRTFRHAATMTTARLVDRVLSVSAIAVLPPARQRSVAREVRRLVAEDPSARDRRTFRMPYVTEVYVTRRGRERPASDASHDGDQTQPAHFAGAGLARPSYGRASSSRTARSSARAARSHGTANSRSA